MEHNCYLRKLYAELNETSEIFSSPGFFLEKTFLILPFCHCTTPRLRGRILHIPKHTMPLVAMDMATGLVKVQSPSLILMATLWDSLPVEIRHEILSLVGLPWMGRRYKVAKFATVCRDWQVFFETCLFRRLVLDSNSLSEFDAIIRRHDIRLAYIQKLWLRIQLPSYGCSDCDRPENGATQRRYVQCCVGHPHHLL